jgi:hypothetical protein
VDQRRRAGILGYAVAGRRWGHGLAGEAAAAATTFAFTELRLARLRATPLRGNVASRRILERLGFAIDEAGVEEIPRYGGPTRDRRCVPPGTPRLGGQDGRTSSRRAAPFMRCRLALAGSSASAAAASARSERPGKSRGHERNRPWPSEARSPESCPRAAVPRTG